MPTQCGWVRSTYHTKGLDPLGAQAPSIHIYGQLLPGITNVTDRARYYSFYPWVVRAYERLPGKKSTADFIEWVRRADCLFTMIGIRHRYTSGDDNHSLHEQGLIGSRTLHPVIENLTPNDTLHLSHYTMLNNDNKMRYFKNPLGGLTQYYIGTLDGLGFMTTTNSAVANTEELGVPLAECMNSSVNFALFTTTNQTGEVTSDILDALSSFCPCQLATSAEEHKALVDIFFERKDRPTAEGLQRRHTLGLMLDLIHALHQRDQESTVQFDQETYRGCTYSGTLPSGDNWELPAKLETTRKQWSVYQKHELLSVAVQCIFWVALDTLSEKQPYLNTIEDFTQWFGEQSQVKAAAKGLGGTDFRTALHRAKTVMPDYSNWVHDEHEITLAHSALSTYRSHKKHDVHGDLLLLAGKLMLALIARDEGTEPAYTPLVIPGDYFKLYQINLESLRQLARDNWQALTLTQWLAEIAGHWGIEAHLRVALRKLRYQSKDTFHILPTDRGFIVENLPDPTYTSPRFSQAIQILEDLGAISRPSGDTPMSLSCLGEELLGAICD